KEKQGGDHATSHVHIQDLAGFSYMNKDPEVITGAQNPEVIHVDQDHDDENSTCIKREFMEHNVDLDRGDVPHVVKLSNVHENQLIDRTEKIQPLNVAPLATIIVEQDTFNQYKLDDEKLSGQLLETNIPTSTDDVMPMHKNMLPDPWQRSPYFTEFGSASRSTILLTSIFDKKHPFESDPITDPHKGHLFHSYSEWIREGLLKSYAQKKYKDDHYKKKSAIISPPFDFVVKLVMTKDWFYHLSFAGQYWNDEHMNVIFYYLRKKGKYDTRSTYRYTTVDCIFQTRIEEIYDNYAEHKGDITVDKKEDVVCEYIKGYGLIANVPWNTVDEVFIPINCKEKYHWVLAVLSFRYRSIRIYDSYRAVDHDASVIADVEKLAKLLPHYLTLSGFYNEKRGIEWSRNKSYMDKAPSEALDIEFVNNLPQHHHDSKESGVYVAAYAEYLSCGCDIPVQGFYATHHRTRYGSLLWNYGNQKNDAGAVSDNEAPAESYSPRIESETHEKISIE
ncbi:hypothetical protein HAX54_051058, partial [Datura stramonium]|nr:hypothetical protein [Datura stramonium]